jgi:signal-transduction protein with cAMP-binding, CBS, and nucleotidyltransferase domain
MDDPVRVRDVMNRSYVGVSEADSVAGAARLMRDEAVHSAVVLRGRDPVGLLDEDRLLDLVAEGRDPEETTAGEAMRPVVTIDTERPLEQAIAAMTTDGIRHLLVEEDDELVGSLSEHDVVTAHSVLTSRPELAEAQVAQPTAGVGGTESDRDRDVYSTQGVCESCGSLTRELSNHNGQLLCQDCLAL